MSDDQTLDTCPSCGSWRDLARSCPNQECKRLPEQVITTLTKILNPYRKGRKCSKCGGSKARKQAEAARSSVGYCKFCEGTRQGPSLAEVLKFGDDWDIYRCRLAVIEYVGQYVRSKGDPWMRPTNASRDCRTSEWLAINIGMDDTALCDLAWRCWEEGQK